jgi:histidinol-phosphatase
MIDFAINVATQAGDFAYSYFKKQLKVSSNSSKWKNFVKLKADNSPVTPADKNTEKLIRQILAKKFPDHGIIGEEFKSVNPDSEYQWIIDPIDGTKQFIRGIETWCTLLAVLKNKEPFIGIAYYPYSKELFSAQKNNGAYLNGNPIRVSSVSDISISSFSHGALDRFEKWGLTNRLIQICTTVQGKRSFGPYGYNLLWKGHLDFVLEPGGGIYDFAAPAIITEEASGKFSDFYGNKSLTSQNMLLSNGHLHKKVLKILKS